MKFISFLRYALCSLLSARSIRHPPSSFPLYRSSGLPAFPLVPRPHLSVLVLFSHLLTFLLFRLSHACRGIVPSVWDDDGPHFQFPVIPYSQFHLPFSQDSVYHYLGVSRGVSAGTVAAYVGGGLAFDDLQAVRISGKFGQSRGVLIRFNNGDFIR